MAKQDIRLNSVYLKNRIAELGIKQWWLAEQTGVDRKTVIRWVQGHVKSVQPENAEQLAKILECRIEDLSLKNEADRLATPEDQKAAAATLISSSFIEKLGPIGEWNVIESFLKATIVPNLPLNILGELYDKLTIASWRQSKIDSAALYNAKAEEIARQTDDRVLLASVLLSKANILSWRGLVGKSIETYHQCLALQKYIEPRTLGAVHSNLGGIVYEAGDLISGEQYIRKAIEIFQDGGRPLNFAIAHCHLAVIALQTDDVETAEQAALETIRFSEMDDYRRGKIDAKMILAEIAAFKGQTDKAQQLLSQAFQEYSEMNIREGLSYEQAGRTYRRLGDHEKAQALLEKGIEISQGFPVYLAATYAELATVMKLKNDSNWKQAACQALEIYDRCQCPLRVQMLKKQFQIQ